jgi:5-(carboxyamino)imidazole ribonucleotide synthase
VRTLCGLPLGDTKLMSPVVMVNLLGDAWQQGTPSWDRVLNLPEAKLHLYGKHEARDGRKMGHYTVLDHSVEAALQKALSTRAALYPDWKD